MKTTHVLNSIPNKASTTVLALALTSSVYGQAIFTSDFNGFTAPEGNFNGGQFESGQAVAHSGNLPDWEKAGAGTVHVVDTANVFPNIDQPRDFAVMIWQDNVITLADGIPGSNTAGAQYVVQFHAGPAVYQAGVQQTTEGESLLIEVLRQDDTVLAAFTHSPGAWAGELALASESFSYLGDGTGDVRLRIGPAELNRGRFAGLIDDVTITASDPDGPRIRSFTASPQPLLDAGGRVTFEWSVEMPVDSLVITPGDIDVLEKTDAQGQGSAVVDAGPEETTTYTLTATRGEANIFSLTKITIPPPRITMFKATPPGGPAVAPVTLTWEVELPLTSLMLSPGDVDLLPQTNETGAGSFTIDPGPAETTTYTLTARRGTNVIAAKTGRFVVDPENIYLERFDDYSGIQNALQFESALEVSHSGRIPGWTSEGLNDIHAVNLDGAGDFAAMIWQDNILTLEDGVPANDAGVLYEVDFLAGPAVYAAGSQRTLDADGLLIEILRPDDGVLADFVYEPGAWEGSPALEPASFQYTGDGSGAVRIRIGPSMPGSGRFGGAIDNLAIGPAIKGPFHLVHIGRNRQTGVVTIDFTSVSGFNYAVQASTNLADWEALGQPVNAAAEITSFTDSAFALDHRPQAFYRVALLGPPRPFFDDFESGVDGWEATTTSGDTRWELGTPDAGGLTTAHSGRNAWGTNIAGDYTPNATASLRSPVVDLTDLPRPKLSFSYYVDSTRDLEGGQLRFLDENGEAIAFREEIFSGTTGSWTPFSMSLPREVRGRKIIIEFLFLADEDADVGAGWYIDDVAVDR